jgi:tRNA (cmo5U34)-methyltransferase
MTDASAIFDRQAAEYEAPRRRLIPPFDAFYGTAVQAALGLTARPPRRVLDLGAGTGILAARIAAAHPTGLERLVLLDAAPAMLERAEAILGESAEYVVGDLTDPLPAGPWCAVVSALAIHHLEHPAQRELLGRIHAALAPGGVFVNAEQVAGATPGFDALNRAWHRQQSAARGASEAEWAAAEERMAFDRCAGVEDHLEWLRAAGFAEADCLFKDHGFAVIAARRPREG